MTAPYNTSTDIRLHKSATNLLRSGFSASDALAMARRMTGIRFSIHRLP